MNPDTANYVAVFEWDPEDDAWLVHIEGTAGCHSYGRSLRQAASRIREALAAWLDEEPDRLVITSELPKDLAGVVSDVSRARLEATSAGARAQEETVAADRRLTAVGLSRRDAADLLGISHQRVQQLLAS